MAKKNYPTETLILEQIVGGGQSIGTLDDGRKVFVWGGLPNETVEVQITKKKTKMAEGIVTRVVKPSKDRIAPEDIDSYMSTSPWQIMKFDAEQHYKAALIEEAFELHNIILPNPIEVFSNGQNLAYRNKVEFSWYWDKDSEQLELAFFRRGSHGKIPVDGTSLARPKINEVAIKIRDILRQREVRASDLKTLLVRCDLNDNVVAQLYLKNESLKSIQAKDFESLGLQGMEVIFSDPKSPASVITKKMSSWGETSLCDEILGVPFSYSVEGFFQINLPVYEKALTDMKEWVIANQPTIDLYSGVGSIGLTIGGNDLKLVETNDSAVAEMNRNIKKLGRAGNVRAILSPSENVLDELDGIVNVILDPPRAGLHENVTKKLLDAKPQRIVYLSCNPVTQARDVAKLCEKYRIVYHQGYNFFPRTPHIEHLVVMELL